MEKMRKYFLEDWFHPQGGIWVVCKDDHDCVFCDHCTDVWWDYTHLIYAVACEIGSDPWERPCEHFIETEEWRRENERND